jgi:ubiquinone/menaquinone biosynthesis C-methylase UbiE
MYDPAYTKRFYDAYDEAEWSRLEKTAYGRLQAIIHTDFLKRYIKPGDRVLDAGCGPGRFSIIMARLGAKVTVLDISSQQLTLARQKLSEAGAINSIEEFIEGDITDLSRFSDGQFDAVVCFGGALSYVCEKRYQSANELTRITRTEGIVLVSVMSRFGALNGRGAPGFSSEKGGPPGGILALPALDILKTGDLPGFEYFSYSRNAKMNHAPMHLFTAQEIGDLFDVCNMLQVAGSNVTLSEISKKTDELDNEPVWSNLVELEKRMCTDPGLVNSGTHIILAACKY